MSSVAVIDYGMGNLHSIAKALQHANPSENVEITSDTNRILAADRVVFPGVGAIRDCMQAIENFGFTDVLKQVAANKPLLGICIGMEALLTESEENGGTECLGIIPGKVVHFADKLTDSQGDILKVPHMGWNQVNQTESHPLWDGIPQDGRFYFVHSYYAKPDSSQHVAATSNYPTSFACAVSHENIFATQFHPEKSQAVGLKLLENFLAWDGCS
ncbi:MAG: imidazole glycerol phosphate synthase subunit HisH [Methylococcales bacterium]